VAQGVCLAVVEDVTRWKTTERALAAALGEARGSGVHDPATGLFSRRQFDYVLPIELRRAHRYGHPTTLLAIDFVQVGHPPAEAAVVALAAELLSVMRQTDIAFRFEPARFHLVLTHTDTQGAALARRRLYEALAPGLPGQSGERRPEVRIASASVEPQAGPMDYLARARQLLDEVAAGLAA